MVERSETDATYQVTFNGNIAVSDGGTAEPIALAIAINGEPRPTSRAISTPAADLQALANEAPNEAIRQKLMVMMNDM